MATPTPDPYTFQDLKNAYGWNGTEATALGLSPQDKEKMKFTDSENKQKDASKCPQAADIPMNDPTNNVGDILQKSGASQQCVKTSDLYNSASSGSMRAQAESFFGSVGAEAKFMTQTTNERKMQIGCGTLLVKASNIVSKQKAMQCILNSCTQNTDVTVSGSVSVEIKTIDLTPDEKRQKAELMTAQTDERTAMSESDNMLVQNLLSKTNDEQKLIFLQTYIANKQKLLKEAQKQQLDLYSRDINIVDSTVSVTLNQTTFVKVVMSSDAENKLKSLAEDISKDVAEMNVANQLGTNAQDPNVKSIVAQNSAKSSSTASSSLTELAQKTNVRSDGSGRITITAPGVINLRNTKIDANVAVSVILQQMMTQAVANGLDLASKTMNDNQGVQKVLNDVKGLDSYQKAVTEAIKAGTDNTLPSYGGGSSSMIMFAVIGAAVLIGAMVFMNMSKGGAAGPTIVIPTSKFRALADIGHRMRYKMNGFDLLPSFLLNKYALYIFLFIILVIIVVAVAS